MKLSITIEVDDRAPNEEFCGEKCKCLKSGICKLFDIKLESYGDNKVDNMKNGTIVYEKTQEIHTWKRHKQCIDKFYSFCDERNG